MALASSTPLMPSTPGARSGLPVRMASTQFLRDAAMGFAAAARGNVAFPGFGAAKAAFVFSAECADGFAGAPEGDVSAFHDDFAAVASNFEAVGAGGFARCGDEYARRAIFVFHIGGDFVIDFDVVIFAKSDKCPA